MITWERITTRARLADFIDDLIEACKHMLSKTGEHGQTPDVLVSSIIMMVENPLGYIGIALRDGEFCGFLFATVIPCMRPSVAVHAVWGPGVASGLRFDVVKKLQAWAREHGARKITGTITRHWPVLFKSFYEPLGFSVVGVLVESEVPDAERVDDSIERRRLASTADLCTSDATASCGASKA